MKTHHKHSSRRGERSRKAGFYSLAAGAVIVALSLSALVLAGASSMQSDHSIPAGIPAAVAPNAVGPLRAARVAPSSAADAEGSFRPGVLPLVAGTWTAEGPAPIQNGQASVPPM